MNFKKFLLAISLASCAAFAQAQSSVTVYGVLDVGYIGNTYKGILTTPNVSQTTNSLGNSAESPSRIGFKGTEDLGGGTSAFFTVETNLAPTAATVSTWFNRQSFVGLKQNGIGSVSIGTQYTPIFNAIGPTDPDGTPVTVGNMIYSTSTQAYNNAGSLPYEAASSMSADADAFTVRVSNSVLFKSEDYNGLKGQAMFVMNNSNQTQTNATTGGPTNYNGYGFGLSYTVGKLDLAAAMQNLKSTVPGNLTTPTPTPFTGPGGGVNTQDHQQYVGAVYDFGRFKGYAQWINRKATDTINSNYYASRSAEQVGVRSFITPVIESWASIATGKFSQWGVAGSNVNATFRGYEVGTNYWLSKRTNLYAIYGGSNTSIVDVSAVGYAVGVRHTF